MRFRNVVTMSLLFLLVTFSAQGQVIINEVDADTPGTDDLEFVELLGLDASEYSEIRSVSFVNNKMALLHLYPNPAIDKLFVEMSNTKEKSLRTKLSTFDKVGKLVKAQKISTNGISEVDISTLPKSIYTINIEIGDQKISKKIIRL